MAAKLTPWFSGGFKPHRNGLYEVRAGSDKQAVKWAIWKNRQWYLALPSRANAIATRSSSIDMYGASVLWRGLASDPSKQGG